MASHPKNEISPKHRRHIALIAKADNKLLVSACLAGINCTFRGTNNLNNNVKEMVCSGEAIAMCPEILGGLGAPRENIELVGGDGNDVLDGRARAISATGRDMTKRVMSGAERVLDKVKRLRIKRAILKSNSPACGAGYIYDGTFSKKLKAGYGILAALLKRNGIEVLTEKEVLDGQ
jgi:uncharacterized protein YbbK (DUF523 family)